MPPFDDEFWTGFRTWAFAKYSKSWAPTVVCYAKKYHGMLDGTLKDLETFSRSKKNSVMKALVALSKYLGCYEMLKAKFRNYGVKWESQSSFESFVRMMEANNDVLEWVEEAVKVLDESKATFVKFTAISGIRAGEALSSFNMIVKLAKAGKLSEYYNSELESLEHFRFPETFIRGTKNVFFSFVPKGVIEQIGSCETVSYRTLRRHLKEHGLTLRLNELRDYFATFMVHNGLIREEADILQGRVGKSMFMRHYFSPNIEDLKARTLRASDELLNKIN